MLSTRRFFASILPGLPFAGTVVRSGMNPAPPSVYDPVMMTHGAQLMNKAQAALLQQAVPPAMKQYMAAQEAFYNVARSRNEIREMTGYKCVNLNIAALKSVSPQHKIHMHLKQQEDARKQEQSFMSALAESLGLTDFLRKRNTIGQNEEAATEPGPQAYQAA